MSDLADWGRKPPIRVRRTDSVRKNVGDCVHLLGMRRDIPELLQQLDVFVFSAKPDEGLGVALLEAMASGVPIVATRVPACEEVLDNGQLGLLVEPGNEHAMAEAILQIAKESVEFLQPGKGGERKRCSVSLPSPTWLRNMPGV